MRTFTKFCIKKKKKIWNKFRSDRAYSQSSDCRSDETKEKRPPQLRPVFVPPYRPARPLPAAVLVSAAADDHQFLQSKQLSKSWGDRSRKVCFFPIYRRRRRRGEAIPAKSTARLRLLVIGLNANWGPHSRGPTRHFWLGTFLCPNISLE